MSFIIGLLTVVMVLDCLALILLVLIQLPKKDAGAGLAFGGGATDALFGAGSGNVLTKITKYAAGIFFALALILSLLNTRLHKPGGNLTLPKGWNQPGTPPAQVAPPPPAPALPTTTTTTNAPLTIPLPSSNATSPPAEAPVTPPVAPEK